MGAHFGKRVHAGGRRIRLLLLRSTCVASRRRRWDSPCCKRPWNSLRFVLDSRVSRFMHSTARKTKGEEKEELFCQANSILCSSRICISLASIQSKQAVVSFIAKLQGYSSSMMRVSSLE